MVGFGQKIFLSIFLSNYSLVSMSCDPAGAGNARIPVIKVSRSDGDFSRVCATDPINLLLANQAVLGANPRVNGGVVGDATGGYGSDSGSEVVVEFRPIPTASSTNLRGQVSGILNTRGGSRTGNSRYRKVLYLLARSIDDRDARAKQEAKDRRRDSCCNCLATVVNTGIAIAGLGVAVWAATGNKEKQD